MMKAKEARKQAFSDSMIGPVYQWLHLAKSLLRCPRRGTCSVQYGGSEESGTISDGR